MVDIIIACKLSFRLSPLVLPFRNRLMPTHVSYMFYTIPTQYIRMYIYMQCIHITYRHTDTIPGGHHTLFGRQAFAKNCFKKKRFKEERQKMWTSHTCTSESHVLSCSATKDIHDMYPVDTIHTQKTQSSHSHTPIIQQSEKHSPDAQSFLS